MKPFRFALAATLALVLPLSLVAESPAGKIFVYLPWDSPHSLRLTIYFDGVPVAEVQPGKYFVINADPGRHTLMAGDGVPAFVESRASGNSFVCVARHIEIGPSGEIDIPVLEVTSPEPARLDIVNLVYVSPKKVFSPLVNPDDPLLHQRPKLKIRNSTQ